MRGLRQTSLAWAGGVLAVVVLAQSAQAANLRDLLFPSHGANSCGETRQPPPIGRYIEEDGDVAFILDRSSSVTMMRFEDSPEIWALTPEPGPRGDIIYKNDMGEPVLRVTRLCGLTVFSLNHPGGAAASLVGEAPSLRVSDIKTANALLQHFAQESFRATRAVQHLVEFEAPDVGPGSASLFADAATVTAQAIMDLARRADGRGRVAKLTLVRLLPGGKPSASMKGGVLQVVVSAKDGVATRIGVTGRPSSRRIAAAIGH